MAKRRKGGDGGGGGSGDWLNTYADMVTLLLTFFIMLFSMSSLDAAKFNMIVSAFASEVDSSDQIVIVSQGDGSLENMVKPADTPDSSEPLDMTDVYEILKSYVEANALDESVEVSQGEGYIFIRFMEEMIFQPNSARLKDANSIEILRYVGSSIRMIESKVDMIAINGHTAAIIDNPDYAVSDFALSADRALTVENYFESDAGVDPSKMLVVGWGKHQPIAENDTAEGMSRNRRVEILISSENPLADQMANVYEKLMDD